MEEHALGVATATGDAQYDLTFERDLPHPHRAVWAAATDPKRLGQWLADAEVDLRPGGLFRLRGQCNVEGRVLEVGAPSRIVWTWPHPDHPRSQVKITVSSLANGRSRLALVQTEVLEAHLLDVAAGWHTHLDAITAAMTGQRTLYDPKRAAQHFRSYQAAFKPMIG